MSDPKRDRATNGINATTLIEDADNLLTAAWRTLTSPRDADDRQAAMDFIELARAHRELADTLTQRMAIQRENR